MLPALTSWAVSAAALVLAGFIIPGVKLKGGLFSALWVAALYRGVAFCLHWLFFVFLGIGTLGLGFLFGTFTSLLSAALVLKVTSAVSSKLEIKGLIGAFLTACLLAVGGEVTARLLAGTLL